jgi:FecR protein
MTSVLLALVLTQYVVSVKAGLVNHVQGTANVAEMETVPAGRPIETGSDGYVEVLLTPGSFLRIGENSAVVLDGVGIESVSLRVLQGPAVIEVVDLNKRYPIHVTTGKLTMDVVAPGIYRFVDGVATVLDGKLQTPGSKLSYEKGWQVFFQDNYRARKTGKIQVTSLDVYSQVRSQTIAIANASLTPQIANTYVADPYWLFAPYVGFYTFIPHGGNFRSPYGYRYYAAGVRVINSRNSSGTPSGSSGSTTYTPPPTNTGGTGGNNGGDNGGGGTGAPAITVSTPAGERSAPSVYIESKSTPVRATQ